jgi:MFS family permease
MLAACVQGRVFALLFMLIVKEPRRGLSGGAAAVGAADASQLSVLFKNRTYLLVVGSGMATMFVVFACLQWLPTYLIRSYHMTGRAAGGLLGPLLGGVGAASMLCSGYATDVLSRRDIRWGAWIPGLGAALAMPLLAASFYVTDRLATLTLFGLGYFAAMFFSAPNTAMIQYLVPVKLRARATAIFLLMTTLVGFGIGPMIAGYISEAYRPSFGQDSLRFALMTLSPFILISPLLLGIVARQLPRGSASQPHSTSGNMKQAPTPG